VVLVQFVIVVADLVQIVVIDLSGVAVAMGAIVVVVVEVVVLAAVVVASVSFEVVVLVASCDKPVATLYQSSINQSIRLSIVNIADMNNLAASDEHVFRINSAPVFEFTICSSLAI